MSCCIVMHRNMIAIDEKDLDPNDLTIFYGE